VDSYEYRPLPVPSMDLTVDRDIEELCVLALADLHITGISLGTNKTFLNMIMAKTEQVDIPEFKRISMLLSVRSTQMKIFYDSKVGMLMNLNAQMSKRIREETNVDFAYTYRLKNGSVTRIGEVSREVQMQLKSIEAEMMTDSEERMYRQFIYGIFSFLKGTLNLIKSIAEMKQFVDGLVSIFQDDLEASHVQMESLRRLDKKRRNVVLMYIQLKPNCELDDQIRKFEKEIDIIIRKDREKKERPYREMKEAEKRREEIDRLEKARFQRSFLKTKRPLPPIPQTDGQEYGAKESDKLKQIKLEEEEKIQKAVEEQRNRMKKYIEKKELRVKRNSKKWHKAALRAQKRKVLVNKVCKPFVSKYGKLCLQKSKFVSKCKVSARKVKSAAREAKMEWKRMPEYKQTANLIGSTKGGKILLKKKNEKGEQSFKYSCPRCAISKTYCGCKKMGIFFDWVVIQTERLYRKYIRPKQKSEFEMEYKKHMKEIVFYANYHHAHLQRWLIRAKSKQFWEAANFRRILKAAKFGRILAPGKFLL